MKRLSHQHLIDKEIKKLVRYSFFYKTNLQKWKQNIKDTFVENYSSVVSKLTLNGPESNSIPSASSS